MLVFEKIILFNSRYLLRPSKEKLVTYFLLFSCHTHFELKNMTIILYIGFSKLRDSLPGNVRALLLCTDVFSVGSVTHGYLRDDSKCEMFHMVMHI